MDEEFSSMMKQLWAPWRLAYMAAAKPPADGDPCFICRGLDQSDDRANLIVLRTSLSVVLLNRFPYNNGHLLVAPRAHKGSLADLLPDEVLDSQQAVTRMVEALSGLMHPNGYNIGLN